MPYVKPEKRLVYDSEIELLLKKLAVDPEGMDGNLNYVISRLVAGSFKPTTGKWRYAMIARAVAVFECAKLEFYRRIGAKREDEVITDNGDIPEYS